MSVFQASYPPPLPPTSPGDGVAVDELRLQQQEKKQTRGLSCVEINPITEENIINLLISQVGIFFSFSQM